MVFQTQPQNTVASTLNLLLKLMPVAPTTSPYPGVKNEPCVYHLPIPDATSLSPLALGAAYVTNTIAVDNNSPQLYSDQLGLDRYNTLTEEASRFTKTKTVSLPDKLYEEFNLTEVSTKMGLFPEIGRAWIIVDNKLNLWNYDEPSAASITVIDDLPYSILAVKLVKPKDKIFVEGINHLLIVSTPIDIYILLVKHDSQLNTLEVFNAEMAVPAQGLAINRIVMHGPTRDVYMTGEGDGCNLWKLEYSNKEDWFNSKCSKTCLTRLGLTGMVLPGSGMLKKIPGLHYLTSAAPQDIVTPTSSETVLQMEVDQHRGILYTLSSLSIIRAYRLVDGKLGAKQTIAPRTIINDLSTTLGNLPQIESLQAAKFKVVGIHSVGVHERGNLFLVAVTSTGLRIFINGLTFGLSLALKTARVKFPPAKPVEPTTPSLSATSGAFTTPSVFSTTGAGYPPGTMSFAGSSQYSSAFSNGGSLSVRTGFHAPILPASMPEQNQQLAQQHSLLLKNTKLSQMFAPGCFVAVKATKHYDKLFVSIPNYGFLKHTTEVLEEWEFVLDSGALGDGCFINDVVLMKPFTPPTARPHGSANVYANQYLHESLEFAVLTNMGVHFFRHRTPDILLQLLLQALVPPLGVHSQTQMAPSNDPLQTFIELNGMEETCLSLLYLACKNLGGNTGFEGQTKPSPAFRHQVQTLFSTSGENARVSPRAPGVRLEATVDQVVLSDRFYGIVLLVSRLFRDLWPQKVFTKLEHVKYSGSGIRKDTIKPDGLVIGNLNTTLPQLEFFIGSILVLLEFFERFGSSIPGLNAPQLVADPSNTQGEVCMRAEHMALTAVLRLLRSMKEALSFLMVLVEETRNEPASFGEILKFLSVQNQVNLLDVTFRDFMAPTNDEVSNLIKDLLSAILNKNILKGGSIDLVATSLQEKCGSFCSSNDVVIFKAIEKLTKAKTIGSRDPELRVRNLTQSVALFEQCYLTYENIENAVNIMVDLEYHAGAIQFVLNAANKIEDTPETVPRRRKLYQLAFAILAASERTENREATYAAAFTYRDERFHGEFYDWLREQGMADRFLEIDTEYIVPYLMVRAKTDVAVAELLWTYYARRLNYFEAAKILYSLAVSEFSLSLAARIECISRANGFVNCVCPPHLRQPMIQLGVVLAELADVASVQLDVLTTLENDDRLSASVRAEAVGVLNHKILGISEIFNAYVDPLGYYDLGLVIFKISDYKNSGDIFKRWELLFEKVMSDYRAAPGNEPLHVTLGSYFTNMGRRVSDHEGVFPIEALFKLLMKYLHNPPSGSPPGCVVTMFVDSGVAYEKLYHIVRDMIEDNTDLFPGSISLLKGEMVYLIKQWVRNDKHLRGVLDEKVRLMTSYDTATDPVAVYLGGRV